MSERIYSDLMRQIKSGEFVVTGELEPEVTSDIGPTVKEAVAMKPYVIAATSAPIIRREPKSLLV